MGKPTAKPTGEELDRRIQQVYQWLAEAKSTAKIIQNASEMWGVVPRTTHNYIKRARTLLRKDYALERKEMLLDSITLKKLLIERALESDSVTAIAIANNIDDSLCKLVGLHNAPIEPIQSVMNLIKEGFLPDKYIDVLQEHLEKMRTELKQVATNIDSGEGS